MKYNVLYKGNEDVGKFYYLKKYRQYLNYGSLVNWPIQPFVIAYKNQGFNIGSIKSKYGGYCDLSLRQSILLIERLMRKKWCDRDRLIIKVVE